MISLLIFCVIISSGCVLGAVLYEKCFEETLPISCACVIGILFVFGVIGSLNAGVVFLLVGVVLIYIYAIGLLVKDVRRIRAFCKNFFSKGFYIFTVYGVICAMASVGRCFTDNDEFSHWGDIVKVMVTLGDYGTNPLSESLFKTYAPGMALFQYLLQKIYIMTSENAVFSEWRCFFAYQMLVVAFVVPIFAKLKVKRNINVVLIATALLLLPTLFYPRFYYSILIDPFVGVLLGAGWTAIVFSNDINASRINDLYVYSILFMLVQAKDVGLLFASFILLAYVYNEWHLKTNENKMKRVKALCAIMSVVIPKFLWNNNIKANGANKLFAAEIDFINLIEVVIGTDKSYRSEIFADYFKALHSQCIFLGNTGIRINYYVLSLMLVLLIVYMYKKGQDKLMAYKCTKSTVVLLIAEMGVYVVGICLSYMYQFSQEEAVLLPSMQRYLNILYLGMAFFVLEIYAYCYLEWCEKKQEIVALGLLIIVTCVCPLDSVYKFISRYAAEDSIVVRELYDVDNFSQKVLSCCQDDEKIYFIDQEGKGYEYWLFKFLLRPNSFNPNFTWSIGKSFYEGDIWTHKATGEEWKNTLKDNEYTYVVLYDVNEYFCETYGYLFDDASQINDFSVYYFDVEQERLKKCIIE